MKKNNDLRLPAGREALQACVFICGLLLGGSCGDADKNSGAPGVPFGMPTGDSAGDADLGGDPSEQEPSGESLDSCYQGSELVCEIEAAMVQQTNAARAVAGLPALQHSFRVSFAARQWSTTQANLGQLSHDGFPDQRRQDLSDEFGGFQPRLMAENVAAGFPRDESTDAIAAYFVELWLGSEGHRRNILGDYSSIGVGVEIVGSQVYATQIFY